MAGQDCNRCIKTEAVLERNGRRTEAEEERGSRVHLLRTQTSSLSFSLIPLLLLLLLILIMMMIIMEEHVCVDVHSPLNPIKVDSGTHSPTKEKKGRLARLTDFIKRVSNLNLFLISNFNSIALLIIFFFFIFTLRSSVLIFFFFFFFV